MTPDDIGRILNKLEVLTSQTAVNTVATEVLTVEFKAHREQESAQAMIREKTCPHTPTVHKLIADTDALAGIVRKNGLRIDDLETWHNQTNEQDAVDSAEKRIIFTPLKWAQNNVEKIMLAVIIAWLIGRFGF